MNDVVDLDFTDVDIDVALAARVPASVAKRLCAILFAQVQSDLYLATAHDTQKTAPSALARYLPDHKTFHTLQVNRAVIEDAIKSVYGATSQITQITDLEDGNIVTHVRELLDAALYTKASDIHLNPGENSAQCHMRIDGIIISDNRMLTLSDMLG